MAIKFNELTKKSGVAVVNGTILSIDGTIEEKFKSGFCGTKVRIKVQIGDRVQSMDIFGGAGASTPMLEGVMQKGADGKAIKGEDGKAIRMSIKPSQFDNTKHMYMKMLEVAEWIGKEKKTHFECVNEDLFGQALIKNKDMLIGKRVAIKAKSTWKFNQGKFELNIVPQKINIIEKKENDVDRFIVETNLIVNKENLGNMMDGKLPVFVPVWRNFDSPKMVNGFKQTGRNVWVGTNLDINKNNFMNLTDDVSKLDRRIKMFAMTLSNNAPESQFVAMRGLLNYQSGNVSQEIDIKDLVEDAFFGEDVRAALSLTDEEEKKKKIDVLMMEYKSLYPNTVVSKWINKVELLNVATLSEKETESEQVEIAIAPAVEFERCTAEEFENDALAKEAKKSGVSNPTAVAVNDEPVVGASIDSEFPFN